MGAETTRDLAKQVEAKGGSFVASPVCTDTFYFCCTSTTDVIHKSQSARHPLQMQVSPRVSVIDLPSTETKHSLFFAGQLYFVLAGPKALVQKVIPYTKGVMGKGYLDFADQDYGKASILKVLGNSVIFAAVEGLAEGLTLAEKSGVGVDSLVQFVDNMFPGA